MFKKITTAFLLVFFCIIHANAQVGIGTSNPDPSSILDMNSTSAGMLAPRMTTTQRNAISSPATGLLVYDLTESAFYFYDAGWQPIGSVQAAETRDNYKLVKNISDLSDELTAGGGSLYQLNTDYLYEINGTIVFDHPVDLNGAYVEGVDVGEDILVNASGGTFFTGSTAGSLRNVTISGGGQQIFNLSGGTLVVNNSIFAGASSLGSLTGLDLVFMSVTQYVSNANGYTITGCDSFFMNNLFWEPSNTGTFIDFNGAFENVQLANGRVITESGETGIDVASNPTISNSAAMSNISFSGAGTRVRKYTTGTYTNYNFSTAWDVNCEGIPVETDANATGNFYFNGSLTSGFVQLVSSSTPVLIQGSGIFTTSGLFRFTSNLTGNRLEYEGVKARDFQINASLSVRVTDANNDFYAFIFAKNGVLINQSNAVVKIDNASQIQNVNLTAVTNLENGDYIEIYVQRLSGGGIDTMAIFSENLSLK